MEQLKYEYEEIKRSLVALETYYEALSVATEAAEYSKFINDSLDERLQTIEAYDNKYKIIAEAIKFANSIDRSLRDLIILNDYMIPKQKEKLIKEHDKKV
jgi:galactitol-specific phosphotransferase system IIB component